MEFLLISSPDLESAKLPLELHLSDYPRLVSTEKTLKFFKFDGLFVAANILQSNDICAVAFDGSAFDHRQAYYADHWPSLPTCTGYLDGCMDAENCSPLKGVFSLLRVNPHTRAFTIANDPMSLYPIFICGFGDTLIVSNNIYLIETAVQCFGAALTRSTRALALSLLFGCGSGDRTGFREVSLLPPGKIITGIGPNWRLIDQAPSTASEHDGKPPFDEPVSRVRQNIEICSGGADRKILNENSGNELSRSLVTSALGEVQTAQHTPLQPHDDWINAVRLRQGIAFASNTEVQVANETSKTVAVDAFFDTAQLMPRKTPHRGAFFFSNPVSSLIKLSNNDPVYGVALSAFHKKSSKQAARWILAFAKDSASLQPLFRRAFLREATQKLVEELEPETHKDGTLNPRFHDRYGNRQAGLEIRLQNMEIPTHAPFADPWFADASRSVELNVKKQIAITDARSTALAVRQWQECAPHALELASGLPTTTDLWDILDRKKTLSALGKSGALGKTGLQAQKALQLYQMLLWASMSS